MKTKTRRTNTDSVAAEQRAVENAHAGIHKPPAHTKLLAEALPFWNSIMLCRPRHTWTEVDLDLAAQMAQAQADVVRITRALRREGDTIGGKVNPRELMLDRTSRRVERMARIIHVHASATDCEAHDGKKAAKFERDIRNREDARGAAQNKTDDGLIPTLRSVK